MFGGGCKWQFFLELCKAFLILPIKTEVPCRFQSNWSKGQKIKNKS